MELLLAGVIDFVIENCTFISMKEGKEGAYYAFDHYALKGRTGFILLNSTLWDRSEMAIAFAIAHEVAHAYKGYSVSMDNSTREAFIVRETEADELAVRWLSKHYEEESLRALTYERRGFLEQA